MNRRQEIALWIFGVALSLVLLAGDRLSADALFDPGGWHPTGALCILGALVVFRLRDPKNPPQHGVLLAGLAAALVLLAVNELRSMANDLPSSYDVGRVADSIDHATQAIDGVAGSVDMVESSVDGIDCRR